MNLRRLDSRASTENLCCFQPSSSRSFVTAALRTNAGAPSLLLPFNSHTRLVATAEDSRDQAHVHLCAERSVGRSCSTVRLRKNEAEINRLIFRKSQLVSGWPNLVFHSVHFPSPSRGEAGGTYWLSPLTRESRPRRLGPLFINADSRGRGRGSTPTPRTRGTERARPTPSPGVCRTKCPQRIAPRRIIGR